jgi:hypothetical protein
LANRFPRGAWKERSGTIESPGHFTHFVMAAVYRCAVLRQGFYSRGGNLSISHSYQTDKNI